MKVSFGEEALPKGGTVAFVSFKDALLGSRAAELDTATGGALSKALATAKWQGKYGTILEIMAPPSTPLDRIFLIGLGRPEDLTGVKVQHAGGKLAAKLLGHKLKEAAVVVDIAEMPGPLKPTDIPAQLAYGVRLRNYRFDKYKTRAEENGDGNGKKKRKPKDEAALDKLTVNTVKPGPARKQYQALDAIASGVFLTRDLVSEPANVLYPESFVARIEAAFAEDEKVDVEVLNEKQMRKLGMEALLGVGQGSQRESRLVVMNYKGGNGKQAPLAFVGKGVTFDTGGISIKPSANMDQMKWDMGGAGTVVGVMKALSARGAKVNAVGVVGLVENMPDGNAQRPGDVVGSMSGQTIEILNTDAEGRLVLADALWYTQDRFKPQFMIDLATLTGAIIVSLGAEYCGMFANDDDLASKLAEAGEAVDEKPWRFPLHDTYDKDINSDIADMRNIGSPGAAGSIVAAQFLQRFVNKASWAHLDIAGTTWSKKEMPLAPKGGTGFGVRLLDRFVADNYEKR